MGERAGEGVLDNSCSLGKSFFVGSAQHLLVQMFEVGAVSLEGEEGLT